jgi:chemotaxis protein MotB
MKERRRRGHINHERWLVSYADFITLLFAFFVVLYAFARADQKKQVEVTAAIDTAFRSLGVMGDLPRGPAKPSKIAAPEHLSAPAATVKSDTPQSAGQVKADLERIQRELEQRLSSQIAQHTVALEMGRDGLVISLREAGFFTSGSAAPRPETLPTLRQVAASLNGAPYDIRVEGHTDNAPMHNREFDSNWELSSVRATRIARLFLGLKAIPPDRLSAAGYAEFHPIAANSTADGRAQNRRVDLVVMPRTNIDYSTAASLNPTSDSSATWKKITDN